MTTLSILIPTRNRSSYLNDILLSILEWKRDDFEIIIQDNSDDDNTKEIVSKYLSDGRVKYFLDKSDLSVVDNFNLAVRNSRGIIVTSIGDDDGVLQTVMLIADWMVENEVDAVLTDKADYVWPDLISRYNSDYNNSKLKFNELTKPEYIRLDAITELEKVCLHGGTTMGMLPRIYYGLVKRDKLDKVYNVTGEYFPGPSPDMANAVSICLAIETFYYYNFPVFIAGSSSKSTAGLGLKRKHVGKVSEIKHLPKNTLSEWDPLIPEFWSGPTIWAQSASVAMAKMNCTLKINYSYLYARGFVFFPQHSCLIIKKFFLQGLTFKNIAAVLFWYFYNWKLRFNSLLPKVMKKLGMKSSSVVILDNQKTISEAVNSLTHYIDSSERDK